MGMSKPPLPPMTGMPPPAAHPPILGSATIDTTLKAQKAQAGAAVYTADDTIGTSPQGLKTQATTAKATLLGQ
jgi:hypothetical protein